mgnify:FL=1
MDERGYYQQFAGDVVEDERRAQIRQFCERMSGKVLSDDEIDRVLRILDHMKVERSESFVLNFPDREEEVLWPMRFRLNGNNIRIPS